MTQESMDWLRGGNILRGLTDKYGPAWWFSQAADCTPSSHYPGAIPVADVETRLFGWDVTERPLHDPDETMTMTHVGPDGQDVTTQEPITYRAVTGWKSLRRSDTGALLHVTQASFKVHPYREWLIRNFSTLVSDTLVISSGGLLQGGAVAWVQIEAGDIEHGSGVRIRPQMLATTSMNETYASTFKWTATNVVCDNTHRRAMGEDTPTYRVRHTSGSEFDERAARQALGLLDREAAEWELELDELTNIRVGPREWDNLLGLEVPMTDEQGQPLTGRAKTFADKRRSTLDRLWRSDQRVAPWTGTAWGVVQAVNTYATHYATVSGMSRAERQMTNTVAGRSPDSATLGKLDVVLAGGIAAARDRIARREASVAVLA